jgi:ribosome-associated translation inhibitor RaiA
MKIHYLNLIPNVKVQERVVVRLESYIKKHCNENFECSFISSKKDASFATLMVLRHKTKLILSIQSNGFGNDIEDSIQMAITQCESKIRRHKNKIAKHINEDVGITNLRNLVNKLNLTTEVLNNEDFVDDFVEFTFTGSKISSQSAENYWNNDSLDIIAMTIEEAFMKMEFENSNMLIFISKDTGLISILNKTHNGQIVAIRDVVSNPQKPEPKLKVKYSVEKEIKNQMTKKLTRNQNTKKIKEAKPSPIKVAVKPVVKAAIAIKSTAKSKTPVKPEIKKVELVKKVAKPQLKQVSNLATKVGTKIKKIKDVKPSKKIEKPLVKKVVKKFMTPVKNIVAIQTESKKAKEVRQVKEVKATNTNTKSNMPKLKLIVNKDFAKPSNIKPALSKVVTTTKLKKQGPSKS